MLKESLRNLRSSILRLISYNLLPNTLDRKGLVAAINEFTDIVNQKNQLQIVFHVIKPPSLAKEKEIHIFRMLQELTEEGLVKVDGKEITILETERLIELTTGQLV